jgi:putative tryptophan/tyrosine transport system permease protein
MAVDITSSEQKLKNASEASKSPNYAFMIRMILLALVAASFMSLGNVNIGAIGQGFSYGLAGVAVFLTFRILDFPDLTIDGSFPIGGATCAVLIVAGNSPEVSMIAAFVAGALTGLVTAIIHVFFKIEGLLASIIVITGAYTITLRIMDGKSNLPLIGEETLISRYSKPFRAWMIEQFGDDMRRQSNNMLEIIIFGFIVIVTLSILYWFLRTETGLAIRATGKNPQMVQAMGINHNLLIVIGLMVSNGLAGLAGSMAVQQLGFADVSLGVGLIIRGLAAVIIGEVLLRPKSIGQMIIAASAGMLVFDISRAWVFAALDLPSTDIRLVSALVVLSALGAPKLHDRWKDWRKKQQREVV